MAGRPVQQPSGMPAYRYRACEKVELPDRRWPERRLTRAPRWLSTDLREPMSPARRRIMFDLLVGMGYKEIEVASPASGQAEGDFVRSLIEDDAIPEDVILSVPTQAREELVERTLRSLIGVPRAIVHLSHATAPLRCVVPGEQRPGVRRVAVGGSELVMAYAEKLLDDRTLLGYQYSPVFFTETDLEFALEVCEAVMDIWQPEDGREIVLGLPATVERCPPATHADRFEWMSRHLSRRPYVCLSTHPVNDRGRAVAAAELALLAGADRVEGSLFGQGARAGDADLVTLGMNLFSQGVDPQIDFSRIDEVRRVAEHCHQTRVHPRHPYAGDLVYTAFSGSHQDAIKKGFDALADAAADSGRSPDDLPWEVPYLPIDPKDVGRSYEAVIRVNSQSGKGGVAYVLKTGYGLDLPRRMQVEFSRVLQRKVDIEGGELDPDTIWSLFRETYLPGTEEVRRRIATLRLPGHQLPGAESPRAGAERTPHVGAGPREMAAALDALAELGPEVRLLDYLEHPLTTGTEARVACYAECAVGGLVRWGAGIGTSRARAARAAVHSAATRALRPAPQASPTPPRGREPEDTAQDSDQAGTPSVGLSSRSRGGAGKAPPPPTSAPAPRGSRSRRQRGSGPAAH